MTEYNFLSLMAIGDAFGMKYEFVQRDHDINFDELSFGNHPTFHEYKSGHYTDDTQMSLANTEVLLNGNIDNTRDNDFIDSWLSAFKRDPRMGYSRYMQKVMLESETPDDFRNAIDATKGVTSGGAMRAAPFGLLRNINWVVTLTKAQAEITHATTAGVNSALAVALSTHYLHYGGNRDSLPNFLAQKLGHDWNSTENGYTDDPNNGLKIVTQALSAIQGPQALSKVLLRAVNQDYLSDTDTVCALAMVIASRCSDIQNDLPEAMKEEIDNGPYGVDYLAFIDSKILTKYPKQNLYSKKRLFDLAKR